MWVALALALLVLRPPGESLRELVNVFPNALRLVAGHYRDRTLPGSVRSRRRVAPFYNLRPIDLIRDFISVIGFVDNAIVLIWALRATVRCVGTEAVSRHWLGKPAGLGIICRH